MSNIRKAFEGGKAFIPFITCGDPSLEITEQLVYAMEEAGADLIELGIPFSDPTAEGPVIQEANIRALSGGVTTDKVFDMVRKIRRKSSIPMVFMTYANVVFSYGTDRFMKTAKEVGMDGLILPDVPYEEKEEFDSVAKAYGLDLISLIAPTSEDRISMIAKDASGFVYCVSSLGVTGVRYRSHGKAGESCQGYPLCRRLWNLYPGAGKKNGRPLRRRHRWKCHRQDLREIRNKLHSLCKRICRINEKGPPLISGGSPLFSLIVLPGNTTVPESWVADFPVYFSYW